MIWFPKCAHVSQIETSSVCFLGGEMVYLRTLNRNHSFDLSTNDPIRLTNYMSIIHRIIPKLNMINGWERSEDLWPREIKPIMNEMKNAGESAIHIREYPSNWDHLLWVPPQPQLKHICIIRITGSLCACVSLYTYEW